MGQPILNKPILNMLSHVEYMAQQGDSSGDINVKHPVKNPLRVLALAGLILAVTASGNAFAASVWYTSGALISDVQSSSYAELLNSPSENLNVNYGDTINWYNTYINFYPDHSVYGQVSTYTSPSGGEYVSNQGTSDYLSYTESDQGVQATAQVTGSSRTDYTFYIRHHYYGQCDVYTPYESSTTFHVN